MSQVLAGLNVVVSGSDDVAVLAELVSSFDFDALKSANHQPSVSREQFEAFITRMGATMIEAGILDEELVPTGLVLVPLH